MVRARSQVLTTSLRTRYEVTRGIARHVRARQGRSARLRGHMQYIPKRFS